MCPDERQHDHAEEHWREVQAPSGLGDRPREHLGLEGDGDGRGDQDPDGERQAPVRLAAALVVREHVAVGDEGKGEIGEIEQQQHDGDAETDLLVGDSQRQRDGKCREHWLAA